MASLLIDLESDGARNPDLILDAVAVAAEAHRHQQRKGGGVPYISHPLAVGLLLSQMGLPDQVVVAGILHDTLEDTDLKVPELEARFGSRVLALVRAVTEDKSLEDWEERKSAYLRSLAEAEPEARLISLADKYHNLTSVRDEGRVKGEGVWTVFRRGRTGQEWFYRRFAALVLPGVDAQRYPLVDRFKALVEEVFPPT